ncbi:hypothetical protein NEUTE2DRAFT_56331 [Neurospora tetrasperma FGSC 2509]|nr:hypothetical protein NEUTE2DRAFT_56331 [Neurospora tetrasperma FGSC 2509]
MQCTISTGKTRASSTETPEERESSSKTRKILSSSSAERNILTKASSTFVSQQQQQQQQKLAQAFGLSACSGFGTLPSFAFVKAASTHVGNSTAIATHNGDQHLPYSQNIPSPLAHKILENYKPGDIVIVHDYNMTLES